MIPGVMAAHRSVAAADVAPPASAHRYWRLSIGSSQAYGTDHTIGEIEYRAAPGGANLPITAGGTASASTAVYYPASRAFDGSLNRDTGSWVTTGSQQQWVKWDFGVGNAQALTQCTLKNTTTTSGAEQAQHPSLFTVAYSDDDTAWTVAGRKFGHPGGASAESTITLSDTFDYNGFDEYRLYVTAINGGSNCALAEIELNDSDGYDVSTAVSSTALSSSNYPGETPNKVFDGSTGTTWTSADGDAGPWWISVSLGGIKASLTNFALQNQNGLGNRMPNTFTLQGRNGGSGAWTDVKAVTGETAWGNLERRVYTI
jgi:hypothetical protein